MDFFYNIIEKILNQKEIKNFIFLETIKKIIAYNIKDIKSILEEIKQETIPFKKLSKLSIFYKTLLKAFNQELDIRHISIHVHKCIHNYSEKYFNILDIIKESPITKSMDETYNENLMGLGKNFRNEFREILKDNIVDSLMFDVFFISFLLLVRFIKNAEKNFFVLLIKYFFFFIFFFLLKKNNLKLLNLVSKKEELIKLVFKDYLSNIYYIFFYFGKQNLKTKILIKKLKEDITYSIDIYNSQLWFFYPYKIKEQWREIYENKIDLENISDKKKFFIELIINSLIFKYTFNDENILIKYSTILTLKEPIYNKFILKENLKEELIYLENLILEKSSDYLKNSKIDFIATIFFNSSSKIKNALEEFVDLNIIHFIQNLYTHSSVEKFNSICLKNEKALNWF